MWFALIGAACVHHIGFPQPVAIQCGLHQRKEPSSCTALHGFFWPVFQAVVAPPELKPRFQVGTWRELQTHPQLQHAAGGGLRGDAWNPWRFGLAANDAVTELASNRCATSIATPEASPRASCRVHIVPGRGPAAVQHPAQTSVTSTLGNIKHSLRGTGHRVSSKHLPRYRAEITYRLNRQFSLRVRSPRLAMSPCVLRPCLAEHSN